MCIVKILRSFVLYFILHCFSAIGAEAQSEGLRRPAAVSESVDLYGFAIPVRILDQPAESAEEKAEQIKNDQEDLEAQKSVAESTETLVILTRQQVVIGAIGVGTTLIGTVALIISLHLSRISTKAAVEAARAAREALGSERAWIAHVGQNTIVGSGQINGVFHSKIFAFGLRWKNDGRSPAINVKTYGEFFIGDSKDVIPQLPREKRLNLTDRSVVGSGIEFATSEAAVEWRIAEQLINRSMFLYLYGRIDYNDTYMPELPRYTEGLFLAEVFLTKDRNGNDLIDMHLSPRGERNHAT